MTDPNSTEQAKQREMFRESELAASQTRYFRVGEKIIHIESTAGGCDLTPYGGGMVGEEDLENELRQLFRVHQDEVLEVVRRHARRKRARPKKPRSRNKLATIRAEIAEKKYIDPFFPKQQPGESFYIPPGWLIAARDEPEGPTWTEIQVYGRLSSPVAPIKKGGFCERFLHKPIACVIDLDLHLLAKWLRSGYSSTRKAFESLADRRLIEVENEKTSGALKTVRFLWHPWMELKSALNEHSSPGETALNEHSSRDESALKDPKSALNEHSSPGIEKREREERERENPSSSFGW